MLFEIPQTREIARFDKATTCSSLRTSRILRTLEPHCVRCIAGDDNLSSAIASLLVVIGRRIPDKLDFPALFLSTSVRHTLDYAIILKVERIGKLVQS